MSVRRRRYTNTVLSAEGGPYACPCCGFVTLPQRGAHDLCPVCYWEDDGQDDQDADVVRRRPNAGLSLTAARSNFLRVGACEEAFVGNVRDPLPEEIPVDQRHLHPAATATVEPESSRSDVARRVGGSKSQAVNDLVSFPLDIPGTDWLWKRIPELFVAFGVVFFIGGGVAMLFSNPAGNSTRADAYGPEAPLQPWVVVVAIGMFFAGACTALLLVFLLWQRLSGRRKHARSGPHAASP